MDNILQKINATLDYNERERQEYIDAYEYVFSRVRGELNKTDPLFATYQRKLNQGSHALKTRVGLPDEFDVNVCIKLPAILYHDIEFKNATRPESIQIKISPKSLETLKKNQAWENCKSVEKWIDLDTFYLNEVKFRAWVESKVKQAMDSLLGPGTYGYRVRVTKSGPAFTLGVEMPNSKSFSIDLVPSIVFEYPHWPPNVKEKNAKLYKSSEWFAFAKPSKPHNDNEVTFWRPCFTLQELEIFTGRLQLKSSLRLIKRLRDTNELEFIPTYFINTLFMHKVQKEDDKYWQKPLSEVFMDMLEELCKALEAKEIMCFWVKRENLLNRLTDNQIKHASNKLSGIRKSVIRDYREIDKFIK